MRLNTNVNFQQTDDDLIHSTNEIIRQCELFWLAHLITLDVLKERWNLTPEQWLYWSSSSGGQHILNSITSEFLNRKSLL